MSVQLTIPKLGMTMKEATIARWTKSEGEPVKAGEVVLVIETEKLTYEIEAPRDGFLHRVEPEGALLPVGALVGMLLGDPGKYEAPRSAVSAREVSSEPAETLPSPSSAPFSPPPEGRIKASPLARKMAQERGLDLRGVKGTGPGGRIVREDVLRLSERPVPEKGLEEGSAPEPVPGKAVLAELPVSGMRRQIIQHMHRSLQETAQMTLTAEVDATELHRFRQALLKEPATGSLGISYNAILVRMVGRALREQPGVNASVEEGRILQWADIHVGVAMELDEGLIVPVVRHADRLPIPQIERTLQDLFQRARERKLLPDEIQGGTFTITNLGHLGIDGFTPILNRPESGILGVGRILEKPVAVRTSGESRMEIRRRVVLSLTVDHRIVDGAPAARFLRRVGDLIEEPFLLIS